MDINRYQIKTPTEIVTTTLGIPEGYKQECIQEAYKIGDKQGQQTNVKALMSSYHIWGETNMFNTLIDTILDAIKNKISPLTDDRYIYKVDNAWTAIYKEGHYSIPHDHIPHSISFVYYLKANINSSPLIFDGINFMIGPCDDLLVVFKSYLKHSVPIHKGEDRIC